MRLLSYICFSHSKGPFKTKMPYLVYTGLDALKHAQDTTRDMNDDVDLGKAYFYTYEECGGEYFPFPTNVPELERLTAEVKRLDDLRRYHVTALQMAKEEITKLRAQFKSRR